MRWKLEFGQFITLALIFLIIQLALFINLTPRVTIAYEPDQYSKEDIQVINVIERLEWGEISDPLPCWLELKVVSINKIDTWETMKDNAPVPIERSKQILAIELVGKLGAAYDGPLVKNPPQSYMVTMLITQPSWSRLLSSDYALSGSKVKFCVSSSNNS